VRRVNVVQHQAAPAGTLRSCIIAIATRCTEDPLGNTIEVLQHLIGGYAHDGQPKTFQELVTPSIIILPAFMAFTIDFDNQMCLSTIEVDDVRLDAMLPAELWATTFSGRKGRPKNPFGLSRQFSELPGSLASLA
jgi:hypothetical protein